MRTPDDVRPLLAPNRTKYLASKLRSCESPAPAMDRPKLINGKMLIGCSDGDYVNRLPLESKQLNSLAKYSPIHYRRIIHEGILNIVHFI